MTRFYASIALAALAMMAAPRVERVARQIPGEARSLTGQMREEGIAVGEFVIDCIVSDIEEGQTQ